MSLSGCLSLIKGLHYKLHRVLISCVQALAHLYESLEGVHHEDHGGRFFCVHPHSAIISDVVLELETGEKRVQEPATWAGGVFGYQGTAEGDREISQESSFDVSEGCLTRVPGFLITWMNAGKLYLGQSI